MTWLADELRPFTALFSGVADLDADLADPATGLALRLERARLDLPVELHVEVDEGGAVRLLGAPPTQHVATTWMPVWHRMRLEVTADGDG